MSEEKILLIYCDYISVFVIGLEVLGVFDG